MNVETASAVKTKLCKTMHVAFLALNDKVMKINPIYINTIRELMCMHKNSVSKNNIRY